MKGCVQGEREFLFSLISVFRLLYPVKVQGKEEDFSCPSDNISRLALDAGAHGTNRSRKLGQNMPDIGAIHNTHFYWLCCMLLKVGDDWQCQGMF